VRTTYTYNPVGLVAFELSILFGGMRLDESWIAVSTAGGRYPCREKFDKKDDGAHNSGL
jgi:hypothetical protein